MKAQFDGVYLGERGWIFGGKVSGLVRGVYISVNEQKKFIFSDLKLTGTLAPVAPLIPDIYFAITDDEAAATKARSLEDIGTIKVQLWRCTTISTTTATAYSNDEANEHKQGPLHEKTKKAGSHVVTYVICTRSPFSTHALEQVRARRKGCCHDRGDSRLHRRVQWTTIHAVRMALPPQG